MNALHITMLGGVAVGKTTLLTVMYNKFEETVAETDLQLNPDMTTGALLADLLGKLQTLPKKVTGGGIPGGAEGQDYIFDLGKKASNPDLRLYFHDYPGGWLLAKNIKEYGNHIAQLLNESAVIMIPIDVPALMANGGVYHNKVNRPSQIMTLLKSHLNADKLKETMPRLVLFAPVKCEKWVRNGALMPEVIETLENKYSQILSYLSSDPLLPYLSVVLIPIQTVGGVEFSHTEEFIDQNGEIYPMFNYKPTIEGQYNPVDTEQLLRYILRFLLKIYLDERKVGGFWGWIRNVFKVDEKFREAVETFANGCKTSGGFKIYQGKDLLGL